MTKQLRPALDDDLPMIRLLGVLVLTAALFSAGAAPAEGVERAPWSWPVHGPHTVVRPFIAPDTAYSAGHRGIDIATTGLVLAPADGVVHFRGIVVDRPVLSIDHGADVLSSYEPVESSLHKGERVKRGAVIGKVVSGHCAVLCLHFGVRVDNQYINPLLFLGTVQRPVLLPTVGPVAE